MVTVICLASLFVHFAHFVVWAGSPGSRCASLVAEVRAWGEEQRPSFASPWRRSKGRHSLHPGETLFAATRIKERPALFSAVSCIPGSTLATLRHWSKHVE